MSKISKELWLEYIHEQEQSGLSMAEFCNKKDIPLGAMYSMRHNLIKAGELKRTHKSKGKRVAPVEAGAFQQFTALPNSLNGHITVTSLTGIKFEVSNGNVEGLKTILQAIGAQ